ncbi:MAG: bifunctional acetaldehyde-CoA/alcohol dehydrogenase [Clostridia bacterium]|nr:bifunctional acetaldehyde-CoA/alcohol dehydrogenase [Clostridia bacterium]
MDIYVNDEETLLAQIKQIKAAQKEYSTYTQEQVDKIFRAVAMVANDHRIDFAKMAYEETGMGVMEDKVIKNHFASEYIYNAYKNTKSVGVIEEDKAYGYARVADPIGIIAAIVPTTNPTSTVIFKVLLALKTRNGIIISPHPRAKKCTIETARVLLEAAVKAGAPKNIIGWIDEPSVPLSSVVMKSCNIILATGGPAMVKAAYSSGKPAIGVGPGNVPAIIHKSADVKMAVSSIIHSKIFDNGMICASEQAVLVDDEIYDEVKKEFSKRNCYFMTESEKAKVVEVMFKEGALNANIVGKSAVGIAEMAGVKVPEGTKVLMAEVEDYNITTEKFAREKLSPVLAFYKFVNFEDAVAGAKRLIKEGGYGHTSSLYINTVAEPEKLAYYQDKMRTCRILINSPSAFGGIGDVYNFKLAPSLTLGCGTWGGNSVSENVGVKHLLNIKTVAIRRENMLWLRLPEKVYFKKGCLPVALQELKDVMNKKRVFVVTDNFLFNNGYVKPVLDTLKDMDIETQVFFDVPPDPTLSCAKKGAELMKSFAPDAIIAVGGGSAMDAAKIMWVLYEHPEVEFADMAMRFSDIRKRIYEFPKMGEKAYFIAVPTSSGTGSEVTPFAVITDDATGIKYPLADYQLLPNMAIIETDMMMSAPKGLTAASGIDALIHSLEAYVSVMASDYTDGLALQAIKMIFEYLPRCYDNGQEDFVAREKMANAATMAGIAFANAFLGICHSLAHKLGANHHIPHGIANALVIEDVMRFNASETPVKMGTFPQYEYPKTLRKYAQVAEALGLKGNTDEEKLEALIKAIADLKERIGIKRTIAEYNVSEEDFLKTLDDMCLKAFDDQCTGANPRYPLVSELKTIYTNAFYGTFGKDIK